MHFNDGTPVFSIYDIRPPYEFHLASQIGLVSPITRTHKMGKCLIFPRLIRVDSWIFREVTSGAVCDSLVKRSSSAALKVPQNRLVLIRSIKKI